MGKVFGKGAANHLDVGSPHVKSGKLQLRAHHAGERHGASKGQPAGLETKGGDREREHHVGGIFVGVS